MKYFLRYRCGGGWQCNDCEDCEFICRFAEIDPLFEYEISSDDSWDEGYLICPLCQNTLYNTGEGAQRACKCELEKTDS